MRNYELLPSEKAILKMAVNYNEKIKDENLKSSPDEKSNSLSYKLPDCKPPCSPKQAVKQKEEAMRECEFFKDFFFRKTPPCPPHPCPEPSLYCGQDDGFLCPHCPPEVRSYFSANETNLTIEDKERFKPWYIVEPDVLSYLYQCSIGIKKYPIINFKSSKYYAYYFSTKHSLSGCINGWLWRKWRWQYCFRCDIY